MALSKNCLSQKELKIIFLLADAEMCLKINTNFSHEKTLYQGEKYNIFLTCILTKNALY